MPDIKLCRDWLHTQFGLSKRSHLVDKDVLNLVGFILRAYALETPVIARRIAEKLNYRSAVKGFFDDTQANQTP